VSTAYRRHRYHRRHHPGAADRGLLFVLGTGLLALAGMAGIVIGAVAIAGGFESPAGDPNFPRPAGYHFQNWHVKHTITLCVDPEGGAQAERPLLDLVRDAVGGWQYIAGGKLPLTVDGLCPGRGLRHGDGQSVVGWGDLRKAIGQANVEANSWNEVTEADITLRPDMNPSAACVLSILLHEVGHVAGLAHQPADASSVMTPALSCGTALSSSDIVAIRYRYH
jgi:hypothetical protein